jgi:hypothetical protein
MVMFHTHTHIYIYTILVYLLLAKHGAGDGDKTIIHPIGGIKLHIQLDRTGEALKKNMGNTLFMGHMIW